MRLLEGFQLDVWTGSLERDRDDTNPARVGRTPTTSPDMSLMRQLETFLVESRDYAIGQWIGQRGDSVQSDRQKADLPAGAHELSAR